MSMYFTRREHYIFIFTFRFNYFVIQTGSDTVRWHGVHDKTVAHTTHTQPIHLFARVCSCARLAICFIFHRNRRQCLNSSDTLAGASRFFKCKKSECSSKILLVSAILINIPRNIYYFRWQIGSISGSSFVASTTESQHEIRASARARLTYVRILFWIRIPGNNE